MPPPLSPPPHDPRPLPGASASAPPAQVSELLRRLTAGVEAVHLEAAVARLSARYRAERPAPSGLPLIAGAAQLAAYAAVRFPATYAAAVAAFRQVAARRPGWQPRSVLDLGTGLGATLAAAAAVWPSLAEATCVERDGHAGALGSQVATLVGIAQVRSIARHLDTALRSGPAGSSGPVASYDLVTAGYVLNELDPGGARRLAGDAWRATAGVCCFVEPGRPAEYRRLMVLRQLLTEQGAVVVAPCPHSAACPLTEGDWCHFGQRLQRSSTHRSAKGAELSYEDEKFSFVALARPPFEPARSRVIARPARRKGLVVLRVCSPAGVAERAVPRSAGAAYAEARRASWGSELRAAALD